MQRMHFTAHIYSFVETFGIVEKKKLSIVSNYVYLYLTNQEIRKSLERENERRRAGGRYEERISAFSLSAGAGVRLLLLLLLRRLRLRLRLRLLEVMGMLGMRRMRLLLSFGVERRRRGRRRLRQLAGAGVVA